MSAGGRKAPTLARRASGSPAVSCERILGIGPVFSSRAAWERSRFLGHRTSSEGGLHQGARQRHALRLLIRQIAPTKHPAVSQEGTIRVLRSGTERHLRVFFFISHYVRGSVIGGSRYFYDSPLDTEPIRAFRATTDAVSEITVRWNASTCQVRIVHSGGGWNPKSLTALKTPSQRVII